MRVKNTSKLKLALLGMTAAGIIASCRSSYPTTTSHFAVDYQKADVAHGEALVYSSCGGCHFSKETGKFSGMRMHELPGILGKTCSANLTASPKSSPVPSYSDAEFAYLLRTGIARDGHFIPYMLRPNMSDKDLQDIIAYLHSAKGAVEATDTVAGHTHLNFLGRIALHIAGKPQHYKQSVPQPASGVEQGRYLVDNIGCFHCHSKKLTALNYGQPELSKGYLAGGTKFKMPWGKIRGANITADKATGIGNYTKDDFRQAVQHMHAPGGRKLMPPMEAFHLTDTETDAIYAYIQSLPPKHHKIKGQVVAMAH